MQLWIGLHLPQLPLEVFLNPNSSSDNVAVVLDQEKVLGLTVAARASGIKPGMRRGGVLMLDPNARLQERSQAKEKEALDAVAMALLQYTPMVAGAEESVLLMDVGASLTLFSGIRALCSRIRADVRTMGFTARLSCAPTARAAWLLARTGGGRVVQREKMVRKLDTLHAMSIPAARPYASWFEGIGCETIADLRRLPRPGLQRRCGRQLLDTIDSAVGEAPELFDWIETPPVFEAKIELFDRIDNAELLLAGAQRLIVQLIGWLSIRQMAAEHVTLVLEHERGRSPITPSQLDITFADAVWQADHIVRLMKERLSKFELKTHVIGLTLKAVQLKVMEPPTEELFPAPGGSEEDQVRVLELLVARLGAAAVRQSKPVADYRPEVANAWVSVEEQMRKATVAAQLPSDPHALLRPTWLLAKPIALLMRHNRPFYSSPLRVVAGPERVEAGWWSNGAVRDYFIAQGESDSALYWIYKERISGKNGDDEPRFFLHGLFA